MVKLASNESPLPPFPAAIEAMSRAIIEANRYPDADCHDLKEALCRRLDVPRASLILGNGSNELLRVLASATLRPGDEAVMAIPSFIVYKEVVNLMGATPRQVPLDNHRHDLSAMARAVNERTKLVFLCTPNNPTGTAISRREVESFLGDLPPGVLTVLDEAYSEYVEDPEAVDGLKLYKEGRFLAVFRTFSKIYGLAGCRIGYAVMEPALVEALDRVREPFNVNRIAQAGALASLESTDELDRRRRLNREERAFLRAGLDGLGVNYVPTEANFLYIQVPVAEASEQLLSLGIIVRPFGQLDGRSQVRVTIGTREENELFLSGLRSILAARAKAHFDN